LEIFFHWPSRPAELEIKPNQTKSNQIKPKIKGLVVDQPVGNIPGTAPTVLRDSAQMRPFTGRNLTPYLF
jgi:hypothetical protein